MPSEVMMFLLEREGRGEKDKVTVGRKEATKNADTNIVKLLLSYFWKLQALSRFDENQKPACAESKDRARKDFFETRATDVMQSKTIILSQSVE